MVFKNLFDKYYISQKKINTENGIVDNFKVKTGINYLLSLTLKYNALSLNLYYQSKY